VIPRLDRGAPFPPIEQALREPDGLLAAGGDLTVPRLVDAYSRGIFPWFAEGQPVAAEKVMGVLDEINERWGRGTLRSGGVPSDPDWAMRREMMSGSYTTKLDEVWTVRCD
jgi:hypothetical protein